MTPSQELRRAAQHLRHYREYDLFIKAHFEELARVVAAGFDAEAGRGDQVAMTQPGSSREVLLAEARKINRYFGTGVQADEGPDREPGQDGRRPTDPPQRAAERS